MKVPMLDLKAQYEPLLPRVREAMDKVLEENNYIMGHQVKELEEKMAAYLGVRHAIGCASGTDALVLAVQALGIGP
ncbi:MAG TPA: DegT/DnrJ/EryC1/StrS family aminotransferase, partial [Candidatus Syntrophosphaera sp.]|nr:DegT/DnrJ/EryC1/StrS family aminotransferase [Candidatus Syntrophosphaera sp.]